MRTTRLTYRQLEVVELLSRGLTTKQIAVALGVMESTAKTHVQHCFFKLDAHTRTQAVVTAFRQGEIPMLIGGEIRDVS